MSGKGKGSGEQVYPDSVQPGVPTEYQKPEGWQRLTFGDVFQVIERPVKLDKEETYSLVTVKRSRGGVVKRQDSKGSEVKTPTQFRVKDGDFLISRRQIVHGACGILPAQLDGSIVSNEYAVLNPKDNLVLDFMRHFSNTIYFQQTCFHSSIGVHVEKMVFKLDKWLKWNFNLPPLPEQRKIAAILSTWDDSLSTLARLLDAKRQQKRGLAEQLLTGKTRLKGFEGAWEEKKLGEVFYLLIGGTPSRKEATFWDVDKTTENVWLSIADLKEKYASDSKEYISDLGAKKSNVKRIPANTVVMSFKLTLGRAAITTRPLYTNEAICAFIPMQENVVDTEYFYQSIALMDFTDGVDIAVKGATMNKEKLTNFSFSLPPLPEQKAIASVLSTLDAEIASLEALRSKVQEQKRGLMDELLTGRVRVKVEG